MDRIKIMGKHPHLWGLLGLWLLGFWLMLAGPLWAIALVPLGAAVQYLNEYNLHRFIFHLPAPRRQWAFDLLYQAHYGHHDFPTNARLFFAPWWVIVPVLVINLAVAYALGRWLVPDHALAVTAALVLVGGIGTFLSYEWFHMTAHMPVAKSAVERHVTTLHNQHHFRDFSRWFHVSPGGAIVDHMMGTAISAEALKRQQRQEFMRSLGLDPADPRLVSARARFAEKYGLSAQEIERAAR